MDHTPGQADNLAAVLCVSGILAAAMVLVLFQINEFTLLLLALYIPVQFIVALGVYKGKISPGNVKIITLIYLFISLIPIFPAAIYCGAFIYASNNRGVKLQDNNKVTK